MKKVLFFFPHNPYPAKTGAHKRCIELLNGLRELGCHVTFASSTYTSEQKWTPASIEGLRSEVGCDVQLHYSNCFEYVLTKSRNGVFRLLMAGRGRLPVLTSVSMKSWFSRVAEVYDPEIIFMNYIYFDSILNREGLSFQKTIIEMHDLVTLNKKMQDAILEVAGMKQFAKGVISQEVLDLDFFQKRKLKFDKSEFEIYDKYDHTICISENEKNLVDEYAPHTNAVFLPMTHAIAYHKNSYAADCLFCVGPNMFNVQGYYYFLYKLLPLIRARQSDFRLVVTGNFIQPLSPIVTEGIIYKGFVADLSKIYEVSCFFVCPVFGGTGQQVKIVEAMANGLPVIAFESAAKSSPLRHGVNGFIAKSQEEFCEYVLRLWKDRLLCRLLGEEARRTIEDGFDREKLIGGLASVL